MSNQKDRVWANVEPSINGYSDLIATLLNYLSDEEVKEVADNLSGIPNDAESHYETLLVAPHIVNEMEKICSIATGDCKKSGLTEFDKEVVFDNGCAMAIQVVTSERDSTCWTQGVLFSPDREELGVTMDVDNCFAQSYCVTVNDDDFHEEFNGEYEVEVKPAFFPTKLSEV